MFGKTIFLSKTKLSKQALESVCQMCPQAKILFYQNSGKPNKVLSI
jgi:hypothetical protein